MGIIKRSLGGYGEARHYMEISAEQFSQLGELYQYAVVQNRLAWTERPAGNTAVAQNLAARARELCARAADDPDLGPARSLSILGSIAYDRNEWVRAEEYYRQVLENSWAGSDIPRHAWGHIDLGLALTAQNGNNEPGRHLCLFVVINALYWILLPRGMLALVQRHAGLTKGAASESIIGNERGNNGSVERFHHHGYIDRRTGGYSL